MSNRNKFKPQDELSLRFPQTEENIKEPQSYHTTYNNEYSPNKSNHRKELAKSHSSFQLKTYFV
jgi:hypothetical protein